MWVFVETQNAVHIVRVKGEREELAHELHFGCDCNYSTVALDGEEVPVVIHSEERIAN